MQQEINTMLKVSAALTGAIIGWMGVLRPIWAAHKHRLQQRQEADEQARQADITYQQAVLDKLEALDKRILCMDGCIAELQRDNIERAFVMFKMEHGYCTSGMKEAIADTYASYVARGHNHIAKSRIDELMALPEYPSRMKGVPL